MASIDLTLNGIQIPALAGYTPPFGTKKASGGLSTQEVNDNVIAPFVKERPIEITEDSSTGSVEYNASLVINSANAVLTLGSGTYVGCTVKVIAATAGSVSYNSGTTDTLVAGQIVNYIWGGSGWISDIALVHKSIASADNALDIDKKDVHFTYPSSGEVFTGDYWRDGKPIYCYHITTGSQSKTGGTNLDISTDLTSKNIDTYIKAEGSMLRTVGSTLYDYPIGTAMSNDAGNGILYSLAPYYRYDTSVFTVRIGGNLTMSFASGDFYVYYTKATN